MLKGSFAMPKDNDSAFLLDKHERGLQNLDRMAHYRPEDTVDLVVVGAGAGGTVLAQRLARAGWKIVLLEKGPFWDPDRDWVSDEAGAHPIYWTDKRVISGDQPIKMGKNNSGVGVGGTMTHFAGYTPRLHPSDFDVRTREGVAVDWPISYRELRASFERLELELPVAGQHWPWGDPHDYPHGPHPVAGAATKAWQGAERYGIEMRVGPVSITNGVFGNRPHCIYRGFCVQGCKVNAKASPLITHLPDAIERGVEVRADSHGRSGRGRRRDRPRHRGHVRRRRARALPTRRCRCRLRLRDRDAEAAPPLRLPAPPERTRQQRRPGRPLPDGAGSDAERRPLPGGAAHVQGAAA
jgi:choline dehydrogenase-like flavoprotein